MFFRQAQHDNDNGNNDDNKTNMFPKIINIMF